MNLLTRDTDYAIRALIYMATDAKDTFVSTADLERDLKLPRPFMRKILQILQKAGYLVSVKGHNGGFKLAHDPLEIRLIDLMNVFQGNISLGDCLFKKKLCHCVSTCPLRHEVKAIEKMVTSRLQAVTLAELIKQSKSR